MYARILKANPYHDQKGRFATKETGKAATMDKMMDRISKPDGGFTYQPIKGVERKTGFALSPFPGRSRAIAAKDIKPQDIAQYVIDNEDAFADSNNHLGLWHDPDSGMVFLDVSVVVKTAKEADTLSRKYDQKAYFDFSTLKSVVVDANAKSGGAIKGETNESQSKTFFKRNPFKGYTKP